MNIDEQIDLWKEEEKKISKVNRNKRPRLVLTTVRTIKCHSTLVTQVMMVHVILVLVHINWFHNVCMHTRVCVKFSDALTTTTYAY